MIVQCHFAHPANAISMHQSQGATFPKSGAALDLHSERYYGMENVVTSRTPNPDKFTISREVTARHMMPKPLVSGLVELDYQQLSVFIPSTKMILCTTSPTDDTLKFIRATKLSAAAS